MTVGCYYEHGLDGLSPPVIYYDPSSGRFTLAHEKGHAYDAESLDDGERQRIEDVIGWPIWRPEAFADLYAGCSLGLPPHYEPRPYPDGVAPRRLNAICRLVQRAGDP